jgi:L-asparaginase
VTGRRLLVIGLGGTIAMSGPPDAVVPTLSARDLVDSVPGLAETGIEVSTRSFRNLPGSYLGFTDLVELTGVVSGYDGVVVTQGTDTIEESAYGLDLLYGRSEPLVVTGAMRNPTQAGADGPANLLAALATAANPAARGLGVLVVLDDRIHAARRVAKTHSTSVSAFQSPDGGPLGYLVEGRPQIVNRVERLAPIPAGGDRSPRVALHTAVLGDDGRLLAALVPQVDGLVVAGFGVGHVPDGWLGPLDEAAARIPVVLASRTGSGPVLAGTYGFAGGERDLQDRGLISAGYLHPYKARVLLRTALASGAGNGQIRAAFARAGGLHPDVPWPWPG